MSSAWAVYASGLQDGVTLPEPALVTIDAQDMTVSRDGKCKGKLVRLDGLQTELAEPRVIVGATALRPTEFPPGLADWHIVDAGVAQAHEASVVELPVFIAVRAKPVARMVAPLVREAHSDTSAIERPQLLD